MDILGAIVLWVIVAFAAGEIAKRRGRSVIGWFVVCLLFTPLALLLLLALPSNPEGLVDSGHFKKCPHCAELVRSEAIVCRFCGRELPAASEAQPPSSDDGWWPTRH